VTRRALAAGLAVVLGGCAREPAPPSIDVEAALDAAASARAAGTPAGFVRADSLYRAVLASEPEQPEARYGLAGLAVDSRRLWTAQWHLLRLLHAQPEHAGALSLLGLIAYSQQRQGDAIPYLESLAEQRALRFDEAVALADACNGSNRFAQAESLFVSVLERFPESEPARESHVREGLGYARWKQGRLEEAAADLSRAAETGGAPSTGLLLATVLSDLGRPDEAAAALPDLTVDEARGQGILGDYVVLRNRLRLRAGDEEEIRAGVQEVERIAPELPDQVNVPHLLTQMRKHLGDLDGARAASRMHAAAIAAKDRRDDSRAERELLDGAELERAGEAEGALAAYRRGLEVAPDNLNLLCAAGGLLSELGRSDEAREMFARIRALPGGDQLGRVFLMAGADLRRRGLPAAAARRFELAAARLPSDPEPVFLQAIALTEAGDWEAALKVAELLDRPLVVPAR